MGVYRFPQGVIDHIHRTFATFWWGQTGKENTLHWKSWMDLCTPKSFGGLGFRRLDVFNQALLAKQAWRIFKQPESLLARVLKAKYFKNCDFLEAYRGHNAIYSWQSLWVAKFLLKEGLIWSIGDGRDVKIWGDRWLVDENGMTTTTPMPGNGEEMTVSDLIDETSREWRWEMIDHLLNERDKAVVMSIPLSQRVKKDELQWCFSNNGEFTVKSAYMLGSLVDPGAFNEIWAQLWNAKIMPKVKHFCWRILTNTLPTRSILKYRHLIEADSCPQYFIEKETPKHALLTCDSIRTIWGQQNINCSRNDNELQALATMFTQWFVGMEKGDLQEALIKAWFIWFARNQKVFSETETPTEITMARVRRTIEELRACAEKEKTKINGAGRKEAVRWMPPSLGTIKLNVDAAVGVNMVKAGVVFRDYKGDVLAAGVRQWRAKWSPSVAEGKAMWYVINLAIRMGFDALEAETDCQALSLALNNKKSDLGVLSFVLDDIMPCLNYFVSFSCLHVKRDGNSVAHHLTRVDIPESEHVWMGSCPPNVVAYVTMDKLAL